MLQDNIAIEVKDLRKEFKVSLSGKGFLGKLQALFHRRHKVITAVNDIDFKIRRGEFVGYVGEMAPANRLP
jgi:ABC-2 type transport system ATP-binding protein